MNKTGPALWQRAKGIIPGGNQLLSKRSERFLPEAWPAYYARASGCEVWDLDGNRYYDFAQMGVGSCILGYADPDVDTAVKRAIDHGSMCTLNCPEEVALAEKLIEIHPWAEMVRFARTGGEACAVAVRIARAASGKSGIAFCGYHGWHDWYLSANLSGTSNLDGQLLPGLEPAGVPRELTSTVFPFNYNRLDELEKIVTDHPDEIGVIIMEPLRGSALQEGFLDRVREIATRIDAVLIFDEVTSGFRINVGGIHLKLGVEPDITVFGKAMGNGYAISAIVGRRSVMDHAQRSFISSTFWTEKIGFVAALATIDKMVEENVPDYLVQYGELINRGWLELSKNYNVPVHISGIPPLTHISFEAPEPAAVQTLYTQEMLFKGYLLGAAVYTTYAYSEEIIEQFILDSDPVFRMIANALESGNVKSLLKHDAAYSGFKRLT
ncbi:aminotransferase, Class III pyridoxal-phosphate dependent [Olavius algarvensis associated proteobacterium Delta 3]|nr:aminotransferase, Class III pyridoxal-phosphate dependent [Olavius algarvensis associated proteobacterium Delta 3]CAB5114163.1 aminotransferase, Class III pyridoxal-phosphate dependent [Olavius algarvensis associated proteobacterium Delta 3]